LKARIAGAEEALEVKKKIAKKIDRFAVEDQPLSEAAAFLGKLYGIDIKVDPDIRDRKIILSLNNVSIEAALRWSARTADCGYAVMKDGTILFSHVIAMPPEKTDGPWVKEMKEKLAMEVRFNFIEIPLPYWIKVTTQLTGVNAVIAADVDKDTTVTLRINNMPVEMALRWTCREAGVGYSLNEGGILHISSKLPLPEGETDGEWKKEMEKKLEEKISVAYEDVPIDYLFHVITTTAGVNIFFDRRHVDPSYTITFEAKDMTARQALEGVCKAAMIDFTLMDHAVYVHPPKGK
jgi:hypothetical protein